jgi:hypothetical protein
MTKATTWLEDPIDVMYLIHKAFKKEGERLVRVVNHLSKVYELEAIKRDFEFWARALVDHTVNEDKFMTGPIADSMVARQNEEEHARLAEYLDDVASCLINRGFREVDLTIESKKHLIGCAVALQLAQTRHFQKEEELVLPMVRDRMSVDQQLELVRYLLWEGGEEDQRWVWMDDWVVRHLTQREVKLVEAIEDRLGRGSETK